MPDHPWGPSHGESYEPADILAKLEKQIDTIPEDRVKAALEGVKLAIEERNALPGKILKGVLGAAIGLLKP